MLYDFSLPTKSDKVPAGPDWIHEIKHDGYGMMLTREQEAVMLGPDGVSDFNALHPGKHNGRAQLYAFDMLAVDGKDYRRLPLSVRKASLARLLNRRASGIFIAEYEQGDIGHDLFRAACRMCLEGIASKRLDRACSPGRCTHWLKTKNPAHPAYSRVRDQLLSVATRR
jgi:bifunctional non-homologous end joining protein LigD